MDKKIIFKDILAVIVEKNTKGEYMNLGSFKGFDVIEGKQLDYLIFNTSQRLDRNIKYEFRNFLIIFDFLEKYPDPSFYQGEGFKVRIKKIEEFIKANTGTTGGK